MTSSEKTQTARQGVCLIYPNIGPYHLARLKVFAKVMSDFTAVEIASSSVTYSWQTEKSHLDFDLVTVLDGKSNEIPVREQAKRLLEHLERISPQALVVTGYSDPLMRAASKWARNHGVASIMTTDSTKRDKRRFWPREFLKNCWCRKHYDALFLSGRRSLEYFIGLGFPEGQIWLGTDVVDNDYFAKGANAARRDKVTHKKQFGIEGHYFLSVCRLAKVKNFPGLLKAYQIYRSKGGDWSYVIIGSGPQQQQIKQIIVQKNLKGVHLLPWKQYDELPAYYGLASCFILASKSEPWGLVVNEAMACGLPVIVSEICGCVPELVHHGKNGLVFDHRRPEELARHMLDISGGKYDLESMGSESRKIVADFTPETWAKSLKVCIETTIKAKKR